MKKLLLCLVVGILGYANVYAGISLQPGPVVGYSNGTVPPVGTVGEPATGFGSAVPLTTAVATNCTSAPITAGTWDIEGNAFFSPTGATIGAGGVVASFSSTSATNSGTVYNVATIQGVTFTAGGPVSLPIPPQQVTVASGSTIYYAVVTAQFTGGTLTASCSLLARRRA